MPPRTPRGFRRSDNLHLQRPASCDQERDDRAGDLLDRRVSLPSWTTRWARSCASSSPNPAFALMRSIIPNPSRRAASSTSESRLPVLAARTLTWRIRPSSIANVVFIRAILPYYHLSGKSGSIRWGQVLGETNKVTSGPAVDEAETSTNRCSGPGSKASAVAPRMTAASAPKCTKPGGGGSPTGTAHASPMPVDTWSRSSPSRPPPTMSTSTRPTYRFLPARATPISHLMTKSATAANIDPMISATT